MKIFSGSPKSYRNASNGGGGDKLKPTRAESWEETWGKGNALIYVASIFSGRRDKSTTCLTREEKRGVFYILRSHHHHHVTIAPSNSTITVKT